MQQDDKSFPIQLTFMPENKAFLKSAQTQLAGGISQLQKLSPINGLVCLKLNILQQYTNHSWLLEYSNCKNYHNYQLHLFAQHGSQKINFSIGIIKMQTICTHG